MVITSRLLSGLFGFSSSSFGPFTSSSRGERWFGEQQEESTNVFPERPSFCNNIADGVSSVSDVFGTHIAEVVNTLGPTVTGSHTPSQYWYEI